MKILLLRHGETKGNREKRYVGQRSKEGLTDQAREQLRMAVAGRMEENDIQCREISKIITSPMERCVETAELLFPQEKFKGVPRILREALTECDFGKFEYKNYMELKGDPQYQRFLDSGGTDGFPGGERILDFKRRCAGAVGELVREELDALPGDREGENLVFVVHGGVIMAVMEAFARPARGYFSWQVKNGAGYLCSVKETSVAVQETSERLQNPAASFGFELTEVAEISVL